MTLNKKNWFARYYNWVTGKYPKDVCSFFWGTLMFILLSLFIFIGRLWRQEYSSLKYEYGLMSILGLLTLPVGGIFLFIITAIGNIVLKIFGYEFIYTWAFILGGLGLGILTIATLVGIALGIIWLFKITKKSVGYVVPDTHIVDNTVDFIGAIKGKYCTRITWKD